jgi:hypothetical protein
MPFQSCGEHMTDFQVCDCCHYVDDWLGPSWYGDSVGHYEGDTLVVGIKIGPFAMVDMYGESTASARAARGQQLTARNTGAPDAAKTDALRGRNTALENRPSASVPAPCSRGWAFT